MNSTIETLAEKVDLLVDELRQANMSERTVAHTATAILDRAGIARLDLAEYLRGRGYVGRELARAVGSFGRAVKDAYVRRYRRAPRPLPVRSEFVPGEYIVSSYLEIDRPLVDEVFAEWSR